MYAELESAHDLGGFLDAFNIWPVSIGPSIFELPLEELFFPEE